MITNYTSNSLNSRADDSEKREEVKKVVTGKTKTKTKSEISKIATTMISDEVKSIKEYAIYDVIIPVIKETISQLVKGSIDMLFYGEVRGSSSSSKRGSSNASRVSYRDFYDGKNDDRRDSGRSTSRYSYDDIIFDNRQDAKDVLDRMDEIVEQYGVVRVADLFELAGITGNGHTDQNYGWTNSKSASVERTGQNEYYIKLNRPSPIR